MGFIDGKLCQVCKPVFGQERVFNGKDQIHALKYQGILHACGLLMNFAGPHGAAAMTLLCGQTVDSSISSTMSCLA